MLNREQFLIDNYSKMTCTELAEKLGYKNANTVRTIASRLGLRKRYDVEDMPGEIWLKHPDFPNHLVSNKGRIKSVERNKLISTRVHEGYYDCRINDRDGKKRSPRLHRLVAELFVPNPHGCEVVNHIDGNKLNNSADNLEWTTYSSNTKHAYEHGLTGVRTDTLEIGNVRDICEKLQSGMSISEITSSSPKFTRSRVEKIRQRKRWRQVSGDYRW